MSFNWRSTWSIYQRELLRFLRTAFQSILSPVLTTSLYFIVFGAAIGGRMPDLGGVGYAAFIIPGLLMLTLLGETTSNSSFGIYMPRLPGRSTNCSARRWAWPKPWSGSSARRRPRA